MAALDSLNLCEDKPTINPTYCTCIMYVCTKPKSHSFMSQTSNCRLKTITSRHVFSLKREVPCFGRWH